MTKKERKLSTKRMAMLHLVIGGFGIGAACYCAGQSPNSTAEIVVELASVGVFTALAGFSLMRAGRLFAIADISSMKLEALSLRPTHDELIDGLTASGWERVGERKGQWVRFRHSMAECGEAGLLIPVDIDAEDYPLLMATALATLHVSMLTGLCASNTLNELLYQTKRKKGKK